MSLQLPESINDELDPRFIIRATINSFIGMYRRHITRHNRWTLLDLIGEFGAASGRAEYRDKVFALRALVRNGDQTRVGYSIGRIGLFRSVIEQLVMRDIRSKYIWGLKNALQLEWTVLLQSSRSFIQSIPHLRSIDIPVRFEQGS